LNTLLLKLFYIPAFLLWAGICFSQQNSIDLLERYINDKKWQQADSLINDFIDKKLNDQDQSILDYAMGAYSFHEGNYNVAFDHLEKARDYFINEKNVVKLIKTEGLMIDCISYLNNPRINVSDLINSFCDLANKLDDYHLQSDCQFYLGSRAFEKEQIDEGIKHYKNISELALKHQDSTLYYNNQLNVAMLIGSYQNDPETSITIYKSLIPYFKKRNDTERAFLSSLNLADQYYKLNQPNTSIQILLDANSIKIQTDTIASKQLLHTDLSDYYEAIGDNNKSLKHLKISNILKDSMDIKDQSKAIADIQEKYKTVEKEKQLAKNKNTILALIGTVFFISIIAFLTYRSIKRKQHIAEQEKELEIQKTTQILKEKEIETINAMVEGQEKERLRLAGELHDNLGSTLATVKMQVENLERNLEKVDDPKGLLSKTNTLINEAYQKVRRISHERNSGVMAKEGLLPAVQKLAKQISSSGKLKIEVQDFGLENRLSNHLEITIFRIVQELTTNIVKHAKATEASISLTQHDNELNIIVEDNGKGFKVGKLETKNGMGLGSIERRVEHLEGSMEVDSTIGKGTNIIIDLPIQPIVTEPEE